MGPYGRTYGWNNLIFIIYYFYLDNIYTYVQNTYGQNPLIISFDLQKTGQQNNLGH